MNTKNRIKSIPILVAVAMAILLLTTVSASADVTELTAALTALKDHIEGTAPLNATQIAAHKATIDSNSQYMGDNATVISASMDLVEAYDTTTGFGPLWINVYPPSRDAFTDDLVSTMYWVQQYIIDYTYSAANVVLHETLLNGFIFDCSAKFPGSVAPPTVVTHTATIDASYLDTLGWLRQGDDAPARKPTGTYLAPGTVVTVTVPPELVNSGYQIRVGAHSWDNYYRPPNLRLERSSIVYDITAEQTKVANPLGGGIYIEVPYESANGIVTVDVTGAVRSPYFSAKSFHTTTLTEWQDVERHHPGPWADFQTEKYMTQVPTNWIYDFDDPVTAMANWDNGIDVMNDLMGFPRDRGKETVYTQVDVILRSSVHAPGYPAVNVSDSDPTNGSNGNTGSYLVNGLNYQISSTATEIHEQGHAYFFDKFAGEMESTVNLPYVPILNVTFGYDLDFSLAASRGMQGNPNRTLDGAAIAWMCSFNFSPKEIPMDSAEKAYQLKGHAKFVDIARLFGWGVLNDYYHQLVLENKNKNNSGLSDDDRIFRWCQAVGVDLRPLFHFWGMHPDNPTTLAIAIAAEGLLQSPEIYNALMHYKSILPANNAEFQAYCLGWWGHQPSINGYWTERNHARQWDEEVLSESQYAPNGEIYVGTSCARIQATVDGLLDQYFTLIDAGDDMITWSGKEVQLDATVENEGAPGATYIWSASPGVGVVFSTDGPEEPNMVQDPTVTITKPLGDPNTFTLTLIFDDGDVPIQDTMTIDVYDNACKATIGAGWRANHPTDLVGDDCTTNLEDILEFVKKWLNDSSLPGPIPKENDL